MGCPISSNRIELGIKKKKKKKYPFEVHHEEMCHPTAKSGQLHTGQARIRTHHMSSCSGVLEAEYKVDHPCLAHIRSKLNLFSFVYQT